MLVEDMYLLESSFIRAAEALLRVMKDHDTDHNGEAVSFSKRTIECARDDIRSMIKSCKKESIDIGKNAVFVFEMCPSEWGNNNDSGATTPTGSLLDELNTQCLELYDSFHPDYQIGMITNNVNDTQSVEIGSKEDNEGRQRTFLDVATSTSSAVSSSSIDDDSLASITSPAESCFPIGLQMLIDSSLSLQNDSYIIWITDGRTRHEHQTVVSLRDQIERLNQERSCQIHVSIIGLNISKGDEQLFEDMRNVSKNSIYANTKSEEELIAAVQYISSIMTDNRTTSQFISFLTMEKF